MNSSNSRLKWVSLIFCGIVLLVFALGLYSAGRTMFVQRSFWERVQHRLVREGRVVRAKRGNLLSDEGLLLAASVPQYKIFFDFVVTDKNPKRAAKDQHRRDSLFEAKVDSFALDVAKIIPGVDAPTLAAHLRQGHVKKSRYWAIYKNRINYEQYQAISKLPFLKLAPGKMGFYAETYYTRTNPYGSLAKRTIGSLYPGKDMAKMGLEMGLDSVLRGKDGEARREKVRNSFVSIVTKPAVDGYDVRTTINVKMQDIVEKMLSEKIQEVDATYGICVLMEVKTGDVKAITTLQRNYENGGLIEGPNYAVSQLMEPGSVFKPISFMVAMNDGKLSKNDSYNVGGGIKEMYGRKMRDANWKSGGSGMLTVPDMLAFSSNVGVATMIDRAYRDNTKAFTDGIRRTGLLSNYHIPIPGSSVPRIRSLDPSKGVGHHVDLCWMSIGYVTQIPPIYTLSFYNAIANGGKLVRPRFYTAKLKDGEVVQEYPVVTINEQIAKPQVVQDLQEMLRGVVVKGYGKPAASRYFSVAGKTGTAQVWTKSGRTAEYLVSFAGYFPAEAPEYSMIVCLRKSGGASGGGMCAPVFRRIAESVMALRRNTNYAQAKDSVNPLLPKVCAGNLLPSFNVLRLLGVPYAGMEVRQNQGLAWGQGHTTHANLNFLADATAPNLIPDLRGYGLRDAVYRLELLGLKTRCRGVGLVTAQSLQPGYRYRRGETIVLTLGNFKADTTALKDPVAHKSVANSAPPKPASVATPLLAKPQPANDKPKAKAQPVTKPAVASKPTNPAPKPKASVSKPTTSSHKPVASEKKPATPPSKAVSKPSVSKPSGAVKSAKKAHA